MENKNILLLLESHVDKILLGISVLVSLFLLWHFVVSNPYGEEVQGYRGKLTPSEIDDTVKRKIEAALPELDAPGDPLPPPKNYFSKYDQSLKSAISEISSSVRIPVPGIGEGTIEEKRIYALPVIPSLDEVAIGRLRGAAKIPTEEIAPDRLYASAMSEVGDIDLVTVSARLDVQSLYNNFQQSFRGPRLKTAWKDDRLAKPVLARLEVERRVQQNDRSWGPWEVVPRAVIDPQRKLFDDLPQELDDASFSVDIWRDQFEPPEVQQDILQPEAYSFTISRMEWMSPEFLDEAQKILEKQEQKDRRDKQEELRNRRSTRPTSTRNRTATRRSEPRDRNRGGRTERMNENPATRPTRGATAKERTVEDVLKDFENEKLNEKNVIQSTQDSLLVWVHDDTAEPGETYQYRIRIGVFNPIAGKDWFQDGQADYKNQLVLWSEYSLPTDELSIPERIYVFPMKTIANKETPDDIKGVQVEVAKYYLGQWRDFDFDVYPGEVIGYEVEDIQEGQAGNTADEYQPMMVEMGMDRDPDKVDFTSDMTFVDIAGDIIWGSRLRPTTFYQMLYYDTENKMQQIAVGKSDWSSETRKIYDEIQKEISQGVEQRSPGMMPGGPGDDMMMDEMMMMEMMMQ